MLRLYWIQSILVDQNDEDEQLKPIQLNGGNYQVSKLDPGGPRVMLYN